ncbi:hypothetical protein D3C81_2025120 [compost metagenome]
MDLSGLGQGTHTVPISVKLPEFVELSDTGGPLEVQIELTEKGKPATTVPEDKPQGEQNPGNGSTPPGDGANHQGNGANDSGSTGGTGSTGSSGSTGNTGSESVPDDGDGG